MFGIREETQPVQRKLEQVEACIQSFMGSSRQASEKLSSLIEKLADAANQHDMAIEDLLDSWEELQEKQEEENRSLSAAVVEEKDNQIHQAEKRESALLELIMEENDQLFVLQRAAKSINAGDWVRQFRLTEEKLAARRMAAGLVVVSETNVPVNYAIHEVIDTIEAEDPEQNGRVAEVFSCGYVYMGKTLRKAKVSAFRLEELPF